MTIKTIFLDRDGVINEKLENDYVKNWDEFKFKEGALQAIAGLGKIFGRVFVVTNQRGVGLGLMTEEILNEIHEKMLSDVVKESGRIDKIYYCTETDKNAECRKPNIGIGLKAKDDYPEIEFSKSIMIGDSISDMEFGKNLGMKTCWLENDEVFAKKDADKPYIDYKIKNLPSFLQEINILKAQ